MHFMEASYHSYLFFLHACNHFVMKRDPFVSVAHLSHVFVSNLYGSISFHVLSSYLFHINSCMTALVWPHKSNNPTKQDSSHTGAAMTEGLSHISDSLSFSVRIYMKTSALYFHRASTIPRPCLLNCCILNIFVINNLVRKLNCTPIICSLVNKKW